MQVTATPPRTTTSTSSATAGQSLGAAKVSSDEFLKLLLTQVEHQNPLEPMKDADFASQLAQFSTLQGINQLNSNFNSMLLVQQLTQGASLVGKTVVYQQAKDPSPVHGKVEAVGVHGGSLQLLVGGKSVALSEVTGIL